MESLLRRGQVIPTFTLLDTAGRSVRRTAYRAKKHLVLAFLPDGEDDGARAYLRALDDNYGEMRAAGGEVLAIMRGSLAAAIDVQHDLALPFPVLSDADGKVTASFLPPDAVAGTFVTDRYGELYFVALARNTLSLPPIGELRGWLEAIDNQCAV